MKFKKAAACKILTCLLFFVNSTFSKQISTVITYPAPKGEKLCNKYDVTVDRRSVDIYNVKVASADSDLRFKAVDDLAHSADYFDLAAFGYFSIKSQAKVHITLQSGLYSVKILPASYRITPSIAGNTISFIIKSGQNVTVEFNGDIFHSLHLFADPIPRHQPKPGDPNVIYFGPGIHRVSSMVIGDNKTVYIAGGAIIKAIVSDTEKYTTEPSGMRNYPPTFILAGKNIRFTGQGIIDASECPVHARNLLITFRSSNVTIDGIILQNSSGWTVPVVQSQDVYINDIKIIGYRANTDGIDLCNSNHVSVNNCFVRTNDDLIVVKTWENQAPAHHIVVRNCVLWNQLADALSIGAELREDVSDVLFEDCDIIHDTGREWCLRIFQCDSSTVSNVRFERIRIAQSRQFISLWIGKALPSATKTGGHITNVQFNDIKAEGHPLTIALNSIDSLHRVSNVSFQNVFMNKRSLRREWVNLGPYTPDVTIAGTKTSY